MSADWWRLPPGAFNAITDVPGVRVGHCTRLGGGAATGVTAILPHDGDLFDAPVVAAAEVFNGFGKSAGLMQLTELGAIETPILLTGTFGVPACATALIRHAIGTQPGIGRDLPTVNPLVLECNDGRVNDIQAMHLRPEDALTAIAEAAGEAPPQGTVGAGTGMRSFGFAGGIGTASRMVTVEGQEVRLGAMVLSNFGRAEDLRVRGEHLGAELGPVGPDAGSIVMVLATDAPLSSRQLGRLARRCPAALGRMGSHIGHGSGDLAVAFSTALPKRGDAALGALRPSWPERGMDPLFAATVEAVEEAICAALWHGVPHPGWRGDRLPAFATRFPGHAPR
ncbi:S58 family peptidase [Mesobaculum littorinae]|uniref:S58 family peptidase n=1 Tax=Mesobaculum littorinae TaxID=2486419 RepID=A0A438AKI9_9RHOB|nr:P1 family peptidase [Mesobaculum littorinae]RVV99179.1 S58 family peptidase [Mesobaculum littorinae]